jgi:surface carbohydrate biosynthesis protein
LERLKTTKEILLIPVENQVRELDAKILLACVAAQRGFVSVLGPRRELEFRIASFPKAIYISKSLKSGNGRFFKILHKLDIDVVAWDEEALVHLPAESYFSHRLSSLAIENVIHLFAWGQDNADLWQHYPGLVQKIPIHITGNPRGDLLRPELNKFYEIAVQEIHQIYGNFILINTNFNVVNAFYPVQNLFQPINKVGDEPKLGRSGRNMNREYARIFQEHKQSIFKDFQQLIPTLEQAFPDYAIVVRPHPGENQIIYQKIAAQCKRVHVNGQGSVVPWLKATKALIHNGCTTGVEAYAMGVPTISYRATVDKYWDYVYHNLPNQLSYQCFNFEQLRKTLQKILNGELGAADGDKRKKLIKRHLAAQDGPLACERIVDVLEKIANNRFEQANPDLKDRLKGRYLLVRRSVRKRYRSLLPSSHKKPELQHHNYPGISLSEMSSLISKFQLLLGSDSEELKVEPITDQIYMISK